MIQGLGCRVDDAGFRVNDLGFRFNDLGFFIFTFWHCL